MNIFNIGPMELLLVLVVVLIVFGPNKIPDVGASIGSALRKFRQASKELTEELDLEELNPSSIVDALAAHAEAQEAKTTSEAQAEPAAGPVSPSEPPVAPATTVDAETGAVTAPASGAPAHEPSTSKSRFVVSQSSVDAATAGRADSQPTAPESAPTPTEPVPGAIADAAPRPSQGPSASKPRFVVSQGSLSAATVARGPVGETSADAAPPAPTPDASTPTADYASVEDETEHERQH